MPNSIVEQIFKWADISPSKLALIDNKTEVSYQELRDKILKSRKILSRKNNISVGDCLILAANKQLEFVYTYFAAHLLGIIVVPIDVETNKTRFDYIKNKVKPTLIIGFKSFDEDELKYIDYSSLVSDGVSDNENIEITFPQCDSVADIVFTTGTTGEPKGVILTHLNISSAAININKFIGNQSNDIELLALPISHSFGLGRMRCILSLGSTLILLGSFVNMKRFFRLIEEYKVSGFAMVPASWAYLKKMSGLKLGDYSDSLKYVEIGSAAMPLEEKHLLMSLLPNTRICMHYGLTEASRSTFIEFNSEKNKLSTVGKATPNVTIVLKDEEANDVPIGEEGEICVQGNSVTCSYWKDDLNTKQSFYGGYFRTGDWGAFDEDGYLVLKSRKKELINVGGKKVSPVEVEIALLNIDGITECACVGIEDEVMGEVVKAFIVRNDIFNLDICQINKQLTNNLEHYKIPVAYEMIDSIPKTSSGKIQRLLLKTK